jgi:NAD+ kinase
MCTAMDLEERLPQILHGDKQDSLSLRTRIRCKVKSTFSETRLVPALNDLLIANPSPAAVSRFRMGWLTQLSEEEGTAHGQVISTKTRFAGIPYDISHSLNIWSSGMWVCTSTGSSAAMAAAGGQPMKYETSDLQYLIR